MRLFQRSHENKDSIVGSNFLDERSNIVAGVGPLTIDPKYQNRQAVDGKCTGES